MTITVEISCYPLTESYIEVVDRFILALHEYPGLKVSTSHSSTLIVGESRLVFDALQKETDNTFNDGKASFVMKVLSGDLPETVEIGHLNS